MFSNVWKFTYSISSKLHTHSVSDKHYLYTRIESEDWLKAFFPTTMLVDLPFREVKIAWRFVVYDISATVMPALLFTVAAIHATHQPLFRVPFLIAQSLLYFFLYIYVFCVSNQLTGVDEDRINKPDRPLPSGLVTEQGVWIRFALGVVAFFTAGLALGCVQWALLWLLSLSINNLTPLGKRWITKHVNITVGTFAMMGAAWQIVAPHDELSMAWTVVTALIVFWMITVQDLRDIQGDMQIGRRTLPIVLGEINSRWLIALSFIVAPVLTHIYLFVPAGLTGNAIICEIILGVLCLIIAIRAIALRGKAADHRTYMLFTYWYVALLASAIVVI